MFQDGITHRTFKPYVNYTYGRIKEKVTIKTMTYLVTRYMYLPGSGER